MKLEDLNKKLGLILKIALKLIALLGVIYLIGGIAFAAWFAFGK